MLRALERGLSLSDFDTLTVGMLTDFIIAYNNESPDDENNTAEDVTRMADQSDFDRF